MTPLHETPVSEVDGIGPKRQRALFISYRIQTVEDLLYFYPRRYADRSKHLPISQVSEGEEVLVSGRITRTYVKGGGSKERLVAVLRGRNGSKIEGVWFRGIKGVRHVLEDMDHVAFFGETERYGKNLSMSHPEFFDLGDEDEQIHVGRIVPFYPHSEELSNAGLSQNMLRKIIHNLLQEIPNEQLPTFLPEEIEKKQGLTQGHAAIRAAHFPPSEDQLDEAIYRIKFEELFFLQLLMARERLRRQDAPPISSGTKGPLAEEFIESLPFELTGDQKQSISEIMGDISEPYQMNRLLQGDVGAGKTVVAITSMLEAVDANYQAAFMAPTSVLAEQHYNTLSGYLKPLGIDPVLLTSDLKKSELESRRSKVESGAPITVGTHAIIQDDTEFQDLGFAVVDEQHRFGVKQRRDMFKMGTRPHKLLMTATPIPRSLAMGLYGDLDVSTIEEMPAGRKPVDTRWLEEDQIDSVYEFIENEADFGYQTFVVYPLKQPSPDSELRDVQTGAQEIKRRMPDTVTVETVHGSDPEKEQKMKQFANGDIDVLVSTTVVEVGVDVPNATCIVIREADQFGLSQLHQLRGRVGRSDIQSHCTLVTDGYVTDKAYDRLIAMEKTNDGFEIAERDLQIRGVGDFLGTRQSGMPGTHMADVRKDASLMEKARESATSFCKEDPSLSKYPGVQELLARRFGGEEAELAQVA